MLCAFGLLSQHVVVDELLSPGQDVFDNVQTQHPQRKQYLRTVIYLTIFDWRLNLRQVLSNRPHLIQARFPRNDRSDRQLNGRCAILQILKLFHDDVAELLGRGRPQTVIKHGAVVLWDHENFPRLLKLLAQ